MTLRSVAKSYHHRYSTLKWLSLLDDGCVYKSANNPLVNEFLINVCRVFLALTADIERAFETEELPEYILAILRWTQERSGFGDKV
jgi:hypothetical protein